MAERQRSDQALVNDVVIDFSETPSMGLLPEASYRMRIVSLESRRTRENGILMYVMEFRVVEPAAVIGRPHYEYLMFGTTPFHVERQGDPEYQRFAQLDDPDALDPLTHKRSRGIQMFKTILEMAGQPMIGAMGMAELTALCNSGQLEVGLRLRREEQQAGEYAGTMRNRIGHVFELGTEEIGFASSTTSRRDRSVGALPSGSSRQRASGPQPENMARALNSSRTRETIREHMGVDVSAANTDVAINQVVPDDDEDLPF